MAFRAAAPRPSPAREDVFFSIFLAASVADEHEMAAKFHKLKLMKVADNLMTPPPLPPTPISFYMSQADVCDRESSFAADSRDSGWKNIYFKKILCSFAL